MKKIILTADDLGISKEVNEAVKESCENILTSSPIMANMDLFEEAVNIYKNSNFDIGVHLNIIEGKPLIKDNNNPLTDKNGNFNNSFIQILINSYNKKYMEFVEKEFRAQIEAVINKGIKPKFINSHVHTHSIPKIFELCAKLAKEYDIEIIRTQKENFYFVPDIKRHLKLSYFINIIKHLLLNFFTLINTKTLKKYNLKTNKNFIGVLYTLNMDKNTIIEGIKKLKDNETCEIILHPTKDKSKEKNYTEYLTLIDKNLKLELDKLNVKIVNWSEV